MPTTPVRRTKIVATLGPAWLGPERMHEMLDAGVNVVRINSSHGTAEQRARSITDLRQVFCDRGVDDTGAILVDLRGPRIRVGTLPAPRRLETGQSVTFAAGDEAREEDIPVTYEELAGDVRVGARILLDDGLLQVEVTGVQGGRVTGRVLFGGELKSNKGINLPGVEVSAPALTDSDREELARVVALEVDYIGVSFVRRPADVEQVRGLVPASTKLVAKIEKDTALRQLEGIVAVSDAIMVARGDLGVELPFEELPLAQKRIIREANRQGKPVITATQMLESMVRAPRPTRAEASDVANAILDGTDAVMLSAETSVGAYPVEAVRAMDRIAREVERHWLGRDPRASFLPPLLGEGLVERRRRSRRGDEPPARTEDAIAAAVGAAADMLEAPVIVCFTSSGFTARKIAARRPSRPIFAATPEPATFRQLALVWGVIPALTEHHPTYDSMLAVVRQRLLDLGLAEPGQRLVVTAGVPFDMPGTTNLLKVEAV